MAWIWLDDEMPEHARIAALSPRAFKAFVAGLCYCSRLRTDGRIPAAVAVTLAPRGVRRELEAGDKPFWLVRPGGYEVRRYLDYQLSAHEAARNGDTNRARQRRYRARIRQQTRADRVERNGVTNGVSNGDSELEPVRTDQDHGAGAPPANRTPTQPTLPDVFLKLVAAELDARPELLAEGEPGIREHLKTVCARAHLPDYGGRMLGAALERVEAVRRRTGRPVW
jgi:hypothetical protein